MTVLCCFSRIKAYETSTTQKADSLDPDTDLQQIASKAKYVGSAEHKSYPSPAGSPALRTDATPCNPDVSYGEIQKALQEAISRGCVSSTIEQGYPKYAWGWINEELYEARHINGPAGTYKGYRIDDTERPKDPEGRLNWGLQES